MALIAMASPVPAVSPSISYVIGSTPTTGPFAVPFVFFAATDLEAYLNGTLLTLGTDYSLTGVGVSTGGTFTFLSAQSNADLFIIRNTTIERTTDFPTTGPLVVPALNSELDDKTAVEQDLSYRIGRSIGLDDSDSSTLSRLPAATSRANLLLGFDGNGNVSTYPSSPITAPQSADYIDYLPTWTGAVSATMRERAQRILFLDDFIPDSAAANVDIGASGYWAAAEAAAYAAGMSIYLGSGRNYWTNQTLGSRVPIIGDGTPNISALSTSPWSAGTPLLSNSPSGSYALSSDYAQSIVLRGFGLIGAGSANSGGAGLYLANLSDYSVVEGMRFEHFNNWSLQLSACQRVTIRRNSFLDAFRISTTQVGADHIDLVDGCLDCTITENQFREWYRDAIKCSFVSGGVNNKRIRIVNNDFDTGTDPGTGPASEERDCAIYVETTVDPTIVGNRAWNLANGAASGTNPDTYMGIVFHGLLENDGTLSSTATVVDNIVEIGAAPGTSNGLGFYGVGSYSGATTTNSRVLMRDNTSRFCQVGYDIGSGFNNVTISGHRMEGCVTPATGEWGLGFLYTGGWPAGMAPTNKVTIKDTTIRGDCVISTPADVQAHLVVQSFAMYALELEGNGDDNVPMSTAMQSDGVKTCLRVINNTLSVVGAGGYYAFSSPLIDLSHNELYGDGSVTLFANPSGAVEFKAAGNLYDFVGADFYTATATDSLTFSSTGESFRNNTQFSVDYVGRLQMEFENPKLRNWYNNTAGQVAPFLNVSAGQPAAGSYIEFSGGSASNINDQAAYVYSTTGTTPAFIGGMKYSLSSLTTATFTALVANTAIASLG